MAFNNSLTARLDELRSRNPPRVVNEGTTGGATNTPFRYSGSYMSPPQQASATTVVSEAPALQRRFTGDLARMSPMAPIGQAPSAVGGMVNEIPEGIPAATFKKAKLLEDKRNEYLALQEHRKNFQAQMEAYAQQQAQAQAREQAELDQMTQDLYKAGFNTGHQSEPTTPPEYRESAFPSTFSRPNRYSSSSITSPPGLSGRSHRSGSQLTSPPSDLGPNFQNQSNADGLPSSPNRYSMPVTGFRNRNHETVPEHSPNMGIGPLNTTSFLFDEEEAPKASTTSPDVKSYLQMTDDSFPILVRRDDQSSTLSASSAALDLAFSQPEGAETPSALSRQRYSEQSLPTGTLHALSNVHTNSGTQAQMKSPDSIGTHRQFNRHSMEASLAAYAKTSLHGSSSIDDGSRPNLANFHPSYSTNDVPTLKNNRLSGTDITPPKAQTQQFHNHNASLGRIPPNALNRQSREFSGDNRRDDARDFQHLSSVLQASAAPFAVPATADSPADAQSSQQASFNNVNTFANQQFYGNYGMPLVHMNPMQLNNPVYQQQMQLYQGPQNGFIPVNTANATFGSVNRFHDNQSRAVQQRRAPNGEEHTRFNNVQLESLQGEILSLCKDQHGCRYLQKKLEDRNASNVQIIFLETYQHVIELMTDPFGNYLCQKLLEYSNDDQRTQLIRNAAPDMVKIALNSHGTRALQKMIEFINTPEQTQMIIEALKDRVVELIQDLNGNHVIQKCLNRLSSHDAQFIFDAVGHNCVVVGTHRHGCCVLQRCIDHATGGQRSNLVNQITENAFHLVQDPFGNYVLQYIIDLQESCFTDPMCYTFQGQIPQLSKQKFSSNVIEKCLRGAQPSVTRMMIEEMLNANELEKMLRDSYANYVVQTAMDYGDAEIKSRLIDAIRPILPAVRQTPHGRRIQSKISALDGQGRFSGNATPSDRSGGQTPLNLQMTSTMTGPQSGPISNFNNFNPQPRGGFQPFTSPAPQSFGNQPQYLSFGGDNQPNPVQQPQAFSRVPQVNGGFF